MAAPQFVAAQTEAPAEAIPAVQALPPVVPSEPSAAIRTATPPAILPSSAILEIDVDKSGFLAAHAPALFSPDGDGDNDSVKFALAAPNPDEIKSWVLTVRNPVLEESSPAAAVGVPTEAATVTGAPTGAATGAQTGAAASAAAGMPTGTAAATGAPTGVAAGAAASASTGIAAGAAKGATTSTVPVNTTVFREWRGEGVPPFSIMWDGTRSKGEIV
ncbi:MAG: hypothetical protein Q8O15_06325, partial [Rectinemataceae bacterium]|nr:hypothetical protein [Rectinemataceae bacterium]